MIPYFQLVRPPSLRSTSFRGVVPRSDWSPIDPISVRSLGVPDRITIHHSVTGGTLDDARSVVRMHREERGWPDVGYHFLILGDGRILQGRDWIEIPGRPTTISLRLGAHSGRDNTGNVGICVLGNFETRYPSFVAFDSLVSLSRLLVRELGISVERIFGHRDRKSTLCPGRYLYDLLPFIRDLAFEGSPTKQ